MNTRAKSHEDTAVDLDEGLAHLGHDDFRPGQREAVETLLDSGRLLLVAPTGGGKSLVYQLPACLLPGTTVVVSPLISLMQDQVSALEARGIPATYFASTLKSAEVGRRLRRLIAGDYKLVYAAPERLAFDHFRSALAQLACPLIAIDEAHCISEWGHDFRPEYMQIGELLTAMPHARVLACTATATPVVRDEILARLGLAADTPQLLHGFARPNLALRVHELAGPRERKTHVDAVLRETLGTPEDAVGAAIVYSPTRKITEEEASRLEAAGWRAAGYHAGLDGAVRDRVQKAFSSGELSVVVATNAFGMGIDRADVRCVAHLAPPGSIESYYQEVGRAGRDGKDAVGLLLVSPGDMALRRFLIDKTASDEEADPAIADHKWNLFLELMRWAEGGSCRHDAILRYFGDEAETLSGCGRCDACRSLTDDNREDEEEVTIIVRKALSAVARIHDRFGLGAAANLLLGADDSRLIRSGLAETRTFGILSDRSEQWLMRLLRRCVTAGWVDFHGSDRPVAVLTESGRAVMKAERPARLLLPPERRSKPAAAGKTARKRRAKGRQAPAMDELTLDAAGLQLFDSLRAYRLKIARSRGVPPYVIASDHTLRDIASLKPRTIDELMLAHGIGPAKAENYGPGLLAVVAEHS